MARSNDDFEFDDKFLFEDDPSLDSPNIKEGKVSKARVTYNTTKSLIKSVGKGILSGFKSGLEDSFPNTSSLITEAVSVKDDVVSMKEDIMREIEPTLKTMSTIGARVLPQAEKIIPKKIYEKAYGYLKAHGEDEDAISDEKRLERERESVISGAISTAFADKMEQDATLSLDDKKEKQVDRLIDASRFKELGSVLGTIDSRLETVNTYMAAPMTNYFKASLELKYKHMFISKDLLEHTKATTKNLLARIEEIKHNTGLPDSVKTEGLAKKGKIREALGERLSHLRTSFFKNIKESFKDKFEELTAMVPMLDMATSMMEMGGSKPLTKTDVAAMAAKFLTGAFVKSKVEKKFDQGLLKHIKELTENQTEDAVDRISLAILREAKNWQNEGGLKGMLGDALRDGMLATTNTRVENTMFDKVKEATSFDNLTKTAIISTIPRHLEHIGAHVERLSEKLAGDTQLVDRRYDPSTGMLLESGETLKNMMEKATAQSGFSAYTRKQTIDRFKAVMAHTSGYDINDEQLVKMFEENKTDINKLITNVAINLEGEWNPGEIRKFYEGGPVNEYIKKAFEGVTNPKGLAQFLTYMVYDDKGKLNNVSNLTIEKSIYKEVKNMNSAKVAEVIADHNIRDLAIKKGLYDPKAERITSGALHAMYQPEKEVNTGFKLTVGGVDKGKVAGETSTYNYEVEKLKKVQESHDALQAEYDAKQAEEKLTAPMKATYDLLLGHTTPGEMFESGVNKATEWYNKLKNAFTKPEQDPYTTVDEPSMTEKAQAAGFVRKKAPKGVLIRIKRTASDKTELTIKVPRKSGDEYEFREETVQLTHIPLSTEEVPEQDISAACNSTNKEGVLRKRYHSTKSDLNYFPIKYDPNRVEVLTQPDKSSRYTEFSFDSKPSKQTNRIGRKPIIVNRRRKPAETPAPSVKTPVTNTPNPEQPNQDNGFTRLDIDLSDVKSPFEFLFKKFKDFSKNVVGRFLTPTDKADLWFKDKIFNIDRNLGLLVDKMNVGKDKQVVKTEDSGSEAAAFHLDFVNFSALQLSMMKELVGKDFSDPVIRALKSMGRFVGRRVKNAKDSAAWLYKSGLSMMGSMYNKGKSIVVPAATWAAKNAVPLAVGAAKKIGQGARWVGGKVVSGYKAAGGFVSKHAPTAWDKTKKYSGNLLKMIKDNPDVALSTGIGALMGGLPGAAVGGLVGMTAVPGIKKMAGAFKGMFKKYVDIYEKGKPIVPGNPLLSANRQKEGVFFASGKRVKKSSDIKEPVYGLDNDGYIDSSQVLISKEQIEAGLVDINGKDIISSEGEKEDDSDGVFRKSGSTILESLGHIYKGLTGLLFGTLKKAGSAASTILGRLFGIEGSEIKEYHSKSLEYLSQIAMILDESAVLARKKVEGDADDDGDRDGSWQDQLEKNKLDSYTVELPNKKDKVKGQKGGIISRIVGAKDNLISTVSGMWGSIKSIVSMVSTITPALLAALPYVAITGAAVGGSILGYKGSDAFFKDYDNDFKIRQKFGMDENEKITWKHRLKVGRAGFGEATGLAKIPWLKGAYSIEDQSSKIPSMTEEEINAFRSRMRSYISAGDEGAKKRLEDFERAISKGNWKYAREVSGISSGDAISSGIDTSSTVFRKRTGEDLSLLEDDSDLGRRVTILIDSIDNATKKAGPFAFSKKAKLKQLRDKIFYLHPSELTSDVLQKFADELSALGTEVDITEKALDSMSEQEKDKAELIKRRARLLDAVIVSQKNTKDNLKKSMLGNLKNDILGMSLDNLTSKTLDKFDKMLVGLDSKAIASSSSYMDEENNDKREMRLASLRKKIQKQIDKLPGDFGLGRLMRLRKDATVTGDTVDDEHVNGIENSYNTTVNMIKQYYKSPSGQEEIAKAKQKRFGTTDNNKVQDKLEKAKEQVDKATPGGTETTTKSRIEIEKAKIKEAYDVDVEIDFDDHDEIQDAWREAETKFINAIHTGKATPRQKEIYHEKYGKTEKTREEISKQISGEAPVKHLTKEQMASSSESIETPKAQIAAAIPAPPSKPSEPAAPAPTRSKPDPKHNSYVGGESNYITYGKDGTVPGVDPNKYSSFREYISAIQDKAISEDISSTSRRKIKGALELWLNKKYGKDYEKFKAHCAADKGYNDPLEGEEAASPIAAPQPNKTSESKQPDAVAPPVQQAQSHISEAVPEQSSQSSTSNIPINKSPLKAGGQGAKAGITKTDGELFGNVLMPVDGESSDEYNTRLTRLQQSNPNVKSYYEGDNAQKAKAAQNIKASMLDTKKAVDEHQQYEDFRKACKEYLFYKGPMPPQVAGMSDDEILKLMDDKTKVMRLLNSSKGTITPAETAKTQVSEATPAPKIEPEISSTPSTSTVSESKPFNDSIPVVFKSVTPAQTVATNITKTYANKTSEYISKGKSGIVEGVNPQDYDSFSKYISAILKLPEVTALSSAERNNIKGALNLWLPNKYKQKDGVKPYERFKAHCAAGKRFEDPLEGEETNTPQQAASIPEPSKVQEQPSVAEAKTHVTAATPEPKVQVAAATPALKPTTTSGEHHTPTKGLSVKFSEDKVKEQVKWYKTEMPEIYKRVGKTDAGMEAYVRIINGLIPGARPDSFTTFDEYHAAAAEYIKGLGLKPKVAAAVMNEVKEQQKKYGYGVSGIPQTTSYNQFLNEVYDLPSDTLHGKKISEEEQNANKAKWDPNNPNSPFYSGKPQTPVSTSEPSSQEPTAAYKPGAKESYKPNISQTSPFDKAKDQVSEAVPKTVDKPKLEAVLKHVSSDPREAKFKTLFKQHIASGRDIINDNVEATEIYIRAAYGMLPGIDPWNYDILPRYMVAVKEYAKNAGLSRLDIDGIEAAVESVFTQMYGYNPIDPTVPFAKFKSAIGKASDKFNKTENTTTDTLMQEHVAETAASSNIEAAKTQVSEAMSTPVDKSAATSKDDKNTKNNDKYDQYYKQGLNGTIPGIDPMDYDSFSQYTSAIYKKAIADNISKEDSHKLQVELNGTLSMKYDNDYIAFINSCEDNNETSNTTNKDTEDTAITKPVPAETAKEQVVAAIPEHKVESVSETKSGVTSSPDDAATHALYKAAVAQRAKAKKTPKSKYGSGNKLFINKTKAISGQIPGVDPKNYNNFTEYLLAVKKTLKDNGLDSDLWNSQARIILSDLRDKYGAIEDPSAYDKFKADCETNNTDDSLNNQSPTSNTSETQLNFEETAVSFDGKGKLKNLAKGLLNRVRIGSDPGDTVVHTHPKGTGLSKTDIKSAIQGKLKSIFAVTPEGATQGYDTTTNEITTTYNDMKQSKLADAASKQPEFNTAELESGLNNIHTAESTQVKQLNIVIEKLEALIAAITESKEATNQSIGKASLAAFEAAVNISDNNIANKMRPKPAPKSMLPSELNLSKPNTI